jgi:hypothetical protein
MLIGEITKSPILAALLAVPLFPLILVLVRKGNGLKKSTFLLGLLISANLVSGFYVAVGADLKNQHLFTHLALSLQLIFSALLLRGCTEAPLLKQVILGGITIFTASSLTTLALLPNGDFSILIQSGFVGVFLISIAVLFTLINQTIYFPFQLAEFWYAGGVFIAYGLLIIYFFAPAFQAIPTILNLTADFFIVSHVIQNLFFCAGILAQSRTHSKS